MDQPEVQEEDSGRDRAIEGLNKLSTYLRLESYIHVQGDTGGPREM